MSSEHASDLLINGVAAARGGNKEQARFYLEWFLSEWDITAQVYGTGAVTYDDKATVCFISHSANDKPFCEGLYADLQAKGVRT